MISVKVTSFSKRDSDVVAHALAVVLNMYNIKTELRSAGEPFEPDAKVGDDLKKLSEAGATVVILSQRRHD